MGAPFKDYRVESRSSWGTHQDGALTHDQIMLGATLRIADATEKMATEYDKLIRDRNYQRNRKEELDLENARLRRAVATYRGILKRFKRKRRKA